VEIEGSTGRPLGSPGETAFSAGLFHTFETSGKRDKRIAVAEKAIALAAAETADHLRMLTFDVKAKYAEAVSEQQKLETIQRLLATSREFYHLTDMRVERGDAAPLEGQLFLTDLSRVEAQQIVLSNSADRALLELRKVVGVPASEPLRLASAAIPTINKVSLSALQEQALRSRPDLHILQLLEEQALAEAELTRAEGKPNLTASARYVRVNSAFDQLGFSETGQIVPLQARDNILTFGVSVLLLQSARNQGAIDAILARQAAARLRREHLESVIRLEVEAAFRRWDTATRTIEILNRGVLGQSEKNLAVVRQAHTLGQLRILDVLTEQRRFIETQLVYLDAQSELLQAFAELERTVGAPLP
jgi:cobalt-zinc-cadmium efflux system outer membrane protein